MRGVPSDFHCGTRPLDKLQTKNDWDNGLVVDDTFWHFQCPRCDYARQANVTMFQLSALAKPLWCGACQVSRPTKQWTCNCGEPWFLCMRHGKPPAKIHRQARTAKPQSKFMDATTEREQLIKLDNVKCTPKFSQASAVATRQCLRRSLGCKAKRADIRGHSSTVTIERKNRRRTTLDCIAVEGLDTKGIKGQDP